MSSCMTTRPSGKPPTRPPRAATVPVTNGDVYWDDDEELDLSIRYRINDNFEWTFDAVNLTNDPGRRFAVDPGHPIEYERFGRRYIMGVNFTFQAGAGV